MNYLIKKKSDRFISPRSAERDTKLEKFKVNDLFQTYNKKHYLLQKINLK